MRVDVAGGMPEPLQAALREAERRLPRAVEFSEDQTEVVLLDQTKLPEEELYVSIGSAHELAEAIRSLRVRGAPAIGVAAALGLAVEAGRLEREGKDVLPGLEHAGALLRSTRPTAVNLAWGVDRMLALARAEAERGEDVAASLRGEAMQIHAADRAACMAIAVHGLELLPRGGVSVLTHCNAGALATSGMGTALAPLYLYHALGGAVTLFADETRPLLQGSRITAWEAARLGVEVTVVPDSVAAVLMGRGAVHCVWVGADRIAANGDVANKVGTYGLAVLAHHHGIPFYVAAPHSTLDPAAEFGGDIPIEMRHADEVRRGFGRLTAPADVRVFAPAFDVTPAGLITAIVTDMGVARPPYADSIHALLELA